MALAADCGIVIHCFLAARHAVRIVTSLARQCAFAPGKTFGLTQPVYGTHRLEFVVVTGAGRMIEEECEVLDRLARHVGKRAPIESFDLGGNASTRSFKVALQTNFRTEFGIQAGRIHDADANLFRFGATAPGGSHMLASRSVTPLAVDAFGQVARENRVAAGRFVACRDSRNSVMAKDTLVRYEAASPRMIGIGTRRHRPGSAGFVRIPAQRQLDERSRGSAMQIGPRMVARAQDVIHLHLFDVGFFSRKADLPAPLIDIPHRGGSLRSAYRTAGDRIRCVLCSLLWCSREQDERRSGPCRSGGSRRRSSDDTRRRHGHRRIRLSGLPARPGPERVVRPGPAVSNVTRSVSNTYFPRSCLNI